MVMFSDWVVVCWEHTLLVTCTAAGNWRLAAALLLGSRSDAAPGASVAYGYELATFLSACWWLVG